MITGAAASCSERIQTHTFLGRPKSQLLALFSPFLPRFLLAYVTVVSHTPQSHLRQFLQNQRLFRSVVHAWHTFRSLSAWGVSVCPQRLPAAIPTPLPWVPPRASPAEQHRVHAARGPALHITPPKKTPRSRVAGSEQRLSPRGEVSATPLSAVAAAAPHLAAQRRRSGSGAEPSGPPALQFSPVRPISSQFSPAQLGPAPGRCRASPPRGAAAVATRSEAAGAAAGTMNQTATVSHQGQCQSSRAAKVGPGPGLGRLGGSRGGGRGERGESFRFPRPLGGCPKFARRSCRGAPEGRGWGIGDTGAGGVTSPAPCFFPVPWIGRELLPRRGVWQSDEVPGAGLYSLRSLSVEISAFYYYCYCCFSLGNKLVTQPATCVWLLMPSCENLTPRNFAAAIRLPPSTLRDGRVPLGDRGTEGPSPWFDPPGQGCFVWYLLRMGSGAGS